MARKANPALIGAFVVGATALAVAAIVIFGGGRFFRQTRTVVAYFEGSISGLAIGAPVKFHGVRVGSVTDVKVVLYEKDFSIQTPVFFEIEAKRMHEASGAEVKFQKDAPGFRVLIDRGLRAQLEVQSFVTGQLGIGLDLFPGTPVRLTGLSPDHLEVPTIPSPAEKIAKALETLPIDEIAKATLRTVEGLDRLVNGPDVTETLRSLRVAVADARALVQHLDQRATGALGAVETLARDLSAQVGPLAASVEKTAEEGRRALTETRETVARVGATLEGALEDYRKLVREGGVVVETLREYQKLARDVNTELVPGVKRTLESVRAALEDAQRVLASVDEAVVEGSPLRYDLARAIRELGAAARSVRVLAEYIERQPEAFIFGKDSGGATR